MKDLSLVVKADKDGNLIAKFDKFWSGPIGEYMNAGELFGDLIAYAEGQRDMPSRVLWGCEAVMSNSEDDRRMFQNFLFQLHTGPQDENTLQSLMFSTAAACPASRVPIYDKAATAYIIDSLTDCTMALLSSFSMHRKTLLRCQRCGRWFVPRSRSDELYCMREWNGKSCAEIEKRRHQKAAKREQMKDPIERKIDSATKSLQKREKKLRTDAEAAQSEEAKRELLEEVNAVRKMRLRLSAEKYNHKADTMEECVAWLNDIGVKSRRTQAKEE